MAFGRFFHFFDSAIVLTPVLPRTGIVLCSVGLVWTVVAGWVVLGWVGLGSSQGFNWAFMFFKTFGIDRIQIVSMGLQN